jgi:hypothetical protein
MAFRQRHKIENLNEKQGFQDRLFEAGSITEVPDIRRYAESGKEGENQTKLFSAYQGGQSLLLNGLCSNV